jgi:hypothetical protein
MSQSIESTGENKGERRKLEEEERTAHVREIKELVVASLPYR